MRLTGMDFPLQRQILRLPDPFRGCTMDFTDSPLTKHLKRMKLDSLIGSKTLYTLEVRACVRASR